MPTCEIDPETVRLAQSFANAMDEPVILYRGRVLGEVDYLTQTVWDTSTGGHEFLRTVYPLNLLKVIGDSHA
jgi:hypothetical protein